MKDAAQTLASIRHSVALMDGDYIPAALLDELRAVDAKLSAIAAKVMDR